MANGTRVVEPLPGEYLDAIHSEITTIDSVEKSFPDGPRKQQRIILAAGVPQVTWDEVVNVQPGTTETVVTLLGQPRMKVLGFSATGTGDARFRLVIDGTPVASGHTNISAPSVERTLITGVNLIEGSTATVEVLCRGRQGSDFEATIYAEETDG